MNSYYIYYIFVPHFVNLLIFINSFLTRFQFCTSKQGSPLPVGGPRPTKNKYILALDIQVYTYLVFTTYRAFNIDILQSIINKTNRLLK